MSQASEAGFEQIPASQDQASGYPMAGMPIVNGSQMRLDQAPLYIDTNNTQM
jgi:hypothetical protein